MRIEIGFGSGVQTLTAPDSNIIDVLYPNAVTAKKPGGALIEEALKRPVAAPALEQLVRPGQKIVIITSDITRPVPGSIILPPVLERLWRSGVKKDDITIVFALGSHRRHTEAEMKKLVGEEIYSTIKCMDSSQGNFVHLGITNRGTPVDIMDTVAAADIRIGIGNVEYHYFAGYSGGAKAIMPGVSTRAAIQSNHRLMTLPAASVGNLDNNPVRMDIEEAVSFCSLDFIVNVVLNEHKEIIHAQTGHFIHAHRKCCRFLDSIYQKPVGQLADIVVVSQGGAPKDVNLYQTQKALENAKGVVKKDGIIILVGSCREGLGEAVFEKWMLRAHSPDTIIKQIQENFQLGGHKAAAIALILKKAGIFLVSEMEPALVHKLFMRPFSSVQDAFDAALGIKGKDAGVLIMPYGGSTLPVIDTTRNVRSHTL